MASIGKYILSAASLTQETTLALANLNFDFSIIKLAAPLEYKELGAHLSKKRKREAEDGALHRTARKLGALFVDDLPNIGHLEKAYGLRVSEIASNDKVNPQGSNADGAFEEHVGADGTTIWAAATSGKGAMAVHLLACMLARIFEPAEAISIWSELVSTRKNELQGRLLDDQFHLPTVAASQIEISRDQLARWDTSARSWLKTADDAKSVQQHQLMLILENIDCKISMGTSFPKNIMAPWVKAMEVINQLISGVGQTIQSGEVLLGLAAWHIYPDMLILGRTTTNVIQKDPLVLLGGNATIGLEISKSIKSRGISWSMPLDQLRYYGRSSLSHGSVSLDSSWVSFDQLAIVALGSAISGWGQYGNDIKAVLEFFLALAERLPLDQTKFAWAGLLIRASKEIVAAKDGVSDASRLLGLGKRRPNFLADLSHADPFTLLFGFMRYKHPRTKQPLFTSLEQITIALRQDMLRPEKIAKDLLSKSPYLRSLQSLGIAGIVYADLLDAKVHLALTRIHLLSFDWTTREPEDSPEFTRGLALSIVASFERGHLNIKSESLFNVTGLASENSLYISESLFTDPYQLPKKQILRRIVGNIGRPGTSFLNSPDRSRLNVRESREEDWKVINHALFDGKLENNFDKTSLQISLTGYELPIENGESGVRDRVANVVEAVVSVHDGGSWVMDVDLLPIETIRLDRYLPDFLEARASNVIIMDLENCCQHDKMAPASTPSTNVTVVDSWNELLELPPNAVVVRCNGNWQARIAIAAYLYTLKDRETVITEARLCWDCITAYCIDCGISYQKVIIIN